MAKPKRVNKSASAKSFQFNWVELIILSVCLMAVAAFVGGKFSSKGQTFGSAKPDQQDESTISQQGPWGEIVTHDIQLERAAEFITPEQVTPPLTTWVFKQMNVEQVKAFFTANGLTAEQAEKALKADRFRIIDGDTVIKPDDDFMFSVSPEERQKLYEPMIGMDVNRGISMSMSFPKDKMKSIYSDSRLHADDVVFLKKLVYPREGVMKFSDYEMLMNKIPMGPRRIAMAQVLSQLPATVPSLRIRPDSDIDKIASYWARMENVHFSKLRPLLESLKRLPNGGTISLVYLLPPFARERVFTYPVSQPGDPVMDCHWTSYNFSNLQPDSRFNDQQFANQYFKNNFNKTQEPPAYGDIVILVNEKMNGLHSGVYLADDLVFTKYGNNHMQPWMIVHLSDMLAMYPTSKPIYMRKKT